MLLMDFADPKPALSRLSDVVGTILARLAQL
jgi:hypothetical protein